MDHHHHSSARPEPDSFPSDTKQCSNDPYNTCHPAQSTNPSSTSYKTAAPLNAHQPSSSNNEDTSEEAEVSYLLDGPPSSSADGHASGDNSFDNSFEVTLGTGEDDSMEVDDDAHLDPNHGQGANNDKRGKGGTGLLEEGGIVRHRPREDDGSHREGGESQRWEADEDPYASYPTLKENLHARGLTLYITPECPACLHARVLPLAPNPFHAHIYIIHLLPTSPDPLGLRADIANHIASRGEGMIMDYRWLETCLDVDLLLSSDCRTAVGWA